jgi:hypothetical protein
MAMFGKLAKIGIVKKVATSVATRHGDTINGGVDRAAGSARGRLGRNHHGKVDKVASAAKRAVDSLGGRSGADRRAGDTPSAR